MLKMNFYLYVKLVVLLYADNTVIISESADDLQHAYNEFYTYCNQWKLTVNVEKTKVMVFSEGSTLENLFIFMMKLSNLWKNINI